MNGRADLAARLSHVVQDLDDAVEVMLGAFALDDAAQDDDDDARDTALVALRSNVEERFRRVLANLKAAAYAIDPAAVTPRPAISGADVEWLKGVLDGLGK